MEGRNFHTAVFGGFRKKDVVQFLAEDKRRQEEDLLDLQQQLDEQERELNALRDARDEEICRAEELREQLETERQAAAREKALLEEKIALLEEQSCVAAAEKAALEGRIAQLEQQPQPEPAIDPEELRLLHEELTAEQERVRLLSEQLCRQESQTKPQSMDQLWNLCGKMERTLRQMERMLDGPYRMTCYPEPVEEPELPEVPAEPEIRPAPAAVAEPPAPAQTSSVRNLLQRIRVKR